MAKVSATTKAECLKELRRLLKPGQTVYCVLRHVSGSGMSRRIDFYTIRKGELRFLSGLIANVLGYSRSMKHEGLMVQGCRMDMGFHVVYELSRTLFPKGFVPSRFKLHGRNGTPPGERDPDGGYALKHSWL